MIQLDAELLRELEAILLHGDFELVGCSYVKHILCTWFDHVAPGTLPHLLLQAYLKSSAVLEEAGNDVFASAPLALRLFYVLLQSAFFSSR